MGWRKAVWHCGTVTRKEVRNSVALVVIAGKLVVSLLSCESVGRESVHPGST